MELGVGELHRLPKCFAVIYKTHEGRNVISDKLKVESDKLHHLM
jgi:hypothetical protein